MKKIILFGITILSVAIIFSCSKDDSAPTDIGSNNLTQEQKDFINLLKSKYPSQVIEFVTDFEQGTAPYTLNQVLKFSFSDSGALSIDTNPGDNDGNEIEILTFKKLLNEYVWEDKANDFAYYLSFTPSNDINEINVFVASTMTFLNQLIEYDSGGNISVPNTTSFKFVGNGVDCSAYTQELQRGANQIHINTEKCNGEIYRPTITLRFGVTNPAISVGTYTVSSSFFSPAPGTVNIGSTDYLNPVLNPQVSWNSVEGQGEIVITVNSNDNTKLDVQLKNIKMQNTSFVTTSGNSATSHIPEFEYLTGYIIGL